MENVTFTVQAPELVEAINKLLAKLDGYQAPEIQAEFNFGQQAAPAAQQFNPQQFAPAPQQFPPAQQWPQQPPQYNPQGYTAAPPPQQFNPQQFQTAPAQQYAPPPQQYAPPAPPAPPAFDQRQEFNAAYAPQQPQQAPAPQQGPPTSTPAYTMEQIGQAGSQLVDAGRMAEVNALLGSFGVTALHQLDPARYPEFVMALKGMGAKF